MQYQVAETQFPTVQSTISPTRPLLHSTCFLPAHHAHVHITPPLTHHAGFIQGGRDFAPGSPTLQKLNDQLRLARELLSHEGSSSSSGTTTPLPIGVGFVTFAPSMQHFAATVAPILRQHRPAAVWFFAPEPAAHPESLAHAIRSLRPSSTSPPPPPSHSSSSTAAVEAGGEDHQWTPKIAVQVGSVAAAREAARYGADIVVAQGADAGGHQFVRAAGVVSLVPEIADMLAGDGEEGEEEGVDGGRREVAVWAAGGIADGRGVAAALALGAEGAVLGTRVSCDEMTEHRAQIPFSFFFPPLKQLAFFYFFF